MTFLRQLSRELWHRAGYLASRFSADRCTENAAALTYMSLFALVPLLTVLYTMASAIPAFQGVEEKMQAVLFAHLVPQSSVEIEQYLSDFSQQAKNLTGPGIAFLLVTAILMLRNIEHAFNLIWRARENRSPVSRFMLYWAVLTLAPLTSGLALAISTYFSSFADTLERFDVFGAKAVLLQFAPLVLSTVGFGLVYAAVPNCRVPLKHAVVGGLFTAVAFHAARGIFTRLVVGSSYTFIYGAFAAVPLFLLWIFVSWNIVLIGGILVHSLSAYQSREQANRPLVMKALQVLYLFWQKQKSGQTVREIELLDGRHEVTRGVDSQTWGELRDILIDHHVITQDNKGRFLLSRDLHTVPFWQLKEWVEREKPLATQAVSRGSSWQDHASQLLVDERQVQRERLSTNLVDLFHQ